MDPYLAWGCLTPRDGLGLFKEESQEPDQRPSEGQFLFELPRWGMTVDGYGTIVLRATPTGELMVSLFHRY